MGVYNLIGERLDDTISIKSYFVDEMSNTLEKVRAEVTEPCLVFPVVTDMHRYSEGVPQTFEQMSDNIAKFCELVECDFVVNLGDSIDGMSSQATSLQQAAAITDGFRKVKAPYIYAQGNHDNNPYTSGGSFSNLEFNIAQCFKAFFLNTRDVVVNFSENGTDYYFDVPGIGIRVVVLNSSNVKVAKNYSFGTTTASWLENTAFDTTDTVLLLEHISSISSQVWNNTSGSNYTTIKGKIQDFVNGGGRLIQIMGHSHVDVAFITPWLAVSMVCQKCQQANTTTTEMQKISGYIDVMGSPSRTAGTVTEDAWTVCVLKPNSMELSTIRFGAGVDRYFHYDPIAPTTLTSKLTSPTWSSSNESVATVSGGVVTGVASGTCAILAKDATGNYEAWIVTVS